MLTGAGLGLGSGLLAAAPVGASKISSNEYWAKKRRCSCTAFVSGSRPSFDLTAPSRGEYSLMNTFAQYGFDAWTMDHENYGRSTRSSANADIVSGVEDLKAAVVEYLADLELKFGDQVPTGTYLDMTANLPVVDPAKVLAPVLLVRASMMASPPSTTSPISSNSCHTAIASSSHCPAWHSVVLGVNRQHFWHAMHAFLTLDVEARATQPRA